MRLFLKVTGIVSVSIENRNIYLPIVAKKVDKCFRLLVLMCDTEIHQ